MRLDPLAAPVCSLVILRHTGPRDISSGAEVLVAVRTPETNARFSNTMSVPTQRVPRALFYDVAGATIETPEAQGTQALPAEWFDSETPVVDCPTRFVVESILCRKLGVADALESGTLTFRASRAELAVGSVPVAPLGPGDDSGPETEQLAMLTIVVVVSSGHSAFPQSTACYNPISWVRPVQLVTAVATRDPLVAVPDLDPFEVCVQGMCLTAAARVLDALTTSWGAPTV